MKTSHQLALSAAMSAMLLFAASEADARGRVTIGGWGHVPHHGGGPHRGFHRGIHRGFHGFPLFVIEREPPVIIEREVIREVPVAVAAPEPPPPPREPYVIGRTYAALPGGCMKMIADGASYYLCSGDWYRQIGSGGAARYKAVAAP